MTLLHARQAIAASIHAVPERPIALVTPDDGTHFLTTAEAYIRQGCLAGVMFDARDLAYGVISPHALQRRVNRALK